MASAPQTSAAAGLKATSDAMPASEEDVNDCLTDDGMLDASDIEVDVASGKSLSPERPPVERPCDDRLKPSRIVPRVFRHQPQSEDGSGVGKWGLFA
jgi:hypothetical protein